MAIDYAPVSCYNEVMSETAVKAGLLRAKRALDRIQRIMVDIERSGLDGDVKEEFISFELAAGSFQSTLDEALDARGVEYSNMKPMRHIRIQDEFPLDARVRFVGPTQPKYLASSQVEGTVIAHTRTRVKVRIDDTKEARRFAGVNATVPPTLLEVI